MTKTKKLIDRVFKTIMIVLDILWGTIVCLYGVGVLFADKYAVENSVLSIVMSCVAFGVINLVNIIIRRWIRNY